MNKYTKTITKGVAYTTTGLLNVAHIASHLYIGLKGAEHTHGEHSHIVEYAEQMLHHPAGQIAAMSFVPIMAYDIYKHRQHHKTIQQQKEKINQLESTIKEHSKP